MALLILGLIFLFIGLPISVVWFIVSIAKKNKLKKPIISGICCVVAAFIFMLIGTITYSETDDYKEQVESKEENTTEEKEDDISELESKQIYNEAKADIISKKEYETDGGNMIIAILEDDGKGEFYIFGTANTEEKASIMFATILSKFDNKGDIFNRYSIHVSCESGSISYIDDKDEDNIVITGTNKDGSLSFSTPDWIITEFTMPEEEFNEYTNEIINALLDFVEQFNPEKSENEENIQTEEDENEYYLSSESGEYSDAYQKGKEISEQLIEDMESIDWEENYEKVEECGEKTAEWLNKLFE